MFFYVCVLNLLFNSLNVKVMYRRKIETPFGFVPVSVNFECLRIYATSCWILNQIYRRDFERNYHVKISLESHDCFVRSMVCHFYDLVFDYDK